MGEELDRALELIPVNDVYEVSIPGAKPIRVRASLDETAEGLEREHPGSAANYRVFVAEMRRAHQRLAPLLTADHAGPWRAVRTGAVRALPVLMRSLATILRRSGLPEPVQQAVGIWTHIAGQSLEGAPAPLAFVPALIHSEGCYVPRGGVGRVASYAYEKAVASGVTFRFSTPVEKIVVASGRVTGLELGTGERVPADCVVSNASGIGTLLDLVPGESGMDDYVKSLPLQSPGVAAYIALKRAPSPPYMRFWLAPEDREAPSRLVVQPSVVLPELAGERTPARIVAPLAYDIAEHLASGGQDALLERVVKDPRFAEALGPFEVLARRTPRIYGQRHWLHRDSMNPVMTAAFMRKGRLPHRLKKPKGLYLVGSSTHPGQWVSFCSISGILGARSVLSDMGIDPDAEGG